MREIKNYIKVQSLEEAYDLNQVKTNCIIAGMLWVRTSAAPMGTAIDISGLGLDKIEENEKEIRIGAMVSLRSLELNKSINDYSNNAVKTAVKDIVGVQFRNLATVGGSIWGRFGFSDVLTVFLCMDTYVELYKGGIIPLTDFIEMPKDRDILLSIIVKKQPSRFSYMAVRNQSTDFPILTCAIAKMETEYRIAIGARPMAATLFKADTDMEEIASYVSDNIKTGSNSRGSAGYRKHLAKVLIERCLDQIGEC